MAQQLGSFEKILRVGEGRRMKRLALEDGTRFTLGSTEIVFSRELR